MKQFQVLKSGLAGTRIVEAADMEIINGEIALKVERFGFSANNITYGVAGDTLGYWKFFKQAGEENADWGLLPVWGFAEVTQSKCKGLEIGERLFGYFPPATHVIMKPAGVKPTHFYDGSAHRAELPGAYNLYRRVAAEPGYNRSGDDLRMLLYPLYLTSFAIWDQLKEFGWYGAKQILIVSASSKTCIGLAFALSSDETAPKTVGLTSPRNTGFVNGLGLYDSTISYDDMEAKIEQVPTIIVDMAGNAETLGRLHELLGDNLKKNIDVGITDWRGFGKDKRINREAREFFFAPARIGKRVDDWGAEKYNQQTASFIMDAAAHSARWLKLEKLNGLEALDAVVTDIRDGKISPDRGLIIEM
ncbi:MAG: DUF2855 family protein [Salaquimonas sp.]